LEIIFEQLSQQIINYKSYIFWLGAISFAIFIFSLMSIKWLVSLIPSDYFINKKPSKFKSKYPVMWLVSMIIKNLIGYVNYRWNSYACPSWAGVIHNIYWVNDE
jgi:hypothetical protein